MIMTVYAENVGQVSAVVVRYGTEDDDHWGESDPWFSFLQVFNEILLFPSIDSGRLLWSVLKDLAPAR